MSAITSERNEYVFWEAPTSKSEVRQVAEGERTTVIRTASGLRFFAEGRLIGSTDQYAEPFQHVTHVRNLDAGQSLVAEPVAMIRSLGENEFVAMVFLLREEQPPERFRFAYVRDSEGALPGPETKIRFEAFLHQKRLNFLVTFGNETLRFVSPPAGKGAELVLSRFRGESPPSKILFGAGRTALMALVSRTEAGVPAVFVVDLTNEDKPPTVETLGNDGSRLDLCNCRLTLAEVRHGALGVRPWTEPSPPVLFVLAESARSGATSVIHVREFCREWSVLWREFERLAKRRPAAARRDLEAAWRFRNDEKSLDVLNGDHDTTVKVKRSEDGTTTIRKTYAKVPPLLVVRS